MLLARRACPRSLSRFKISNRFVTYQRSQSISSTPRMLSPDDLAISQGEDRDAVAERAGKLIHDGKWQLCNDGKGLERSFKFKTFKTTWDFMNDIAAECRVRKHHPEWSNLYNKTHIRWTTHDPEGLSTKDTHMAQFCDEAAEKFGELPSDQGNAKV